MTTIAASPLSAAAKSTYREAIRICHPDHVPDERIIVATKLAQELNYAYDQGDEEKIFHFASKVRRWAQGKDQTADRNFTTKFHLKMVPVQPGIPIAESPLGMEKLIHPGNTPLPCITEPFWLSKTPVTQAQWKQVMKRAAPFSSFQSASQPSSPVTNVSWKEAKEFCARATEQSKHSESILFTLPTEAQWEYAYLAGRSAPAANANFIKSLMFDEFGFMKLPKVAALNKKNPLGLHDMHGSVYEWCDDTSPNDFPNSALCRGGWWLSFTNPRVGNRFYVPQDCRNATLGFRVAAVHL